MDKYLEPQIMNKILALPASISLYLILMGAFCNSSFAAELMYLEALGVRDDELYQSHVQGDILEIKAPQIKTEIRYQDNNPIAIIHSYTYPRTEIFYAPGSTEKLVKQMQKALASIGRNLHSKKYKVAVLGAGLNGLLIATTLAEKSYDVTLYADRFTPETSTDKAPIVWPLSIVASVQGKNILEPLEIDSYKQFLKWANEKNSLQIGVSFIDTYIFNDTKKVEILTENGLLQGGANVELEFSNGDRVPGMRFQMPLINIKRLMVYLMKKAEKSGVKFSKRHFACAQDYRALDASIIFNCMGSRSRSLFGELEPFNPDNTKSINFQKRKGLKSVVYFKHKENNFICYVPTNKALNGEFTPHPPLASYF